KAPARPGAFFCLPPLPGKHVPKRRYRRQLPRLSTYVGTGFDLPPKHIKQPLRLERKNTTGRAIDASDATSLVVGMELRTSNSNHHHGEIVRALAIAHNVTKPKALG